MDRRELREWIINKLSKKGSDIKELEGENGYSAASGIFYKNRETYDYLIKYIDSKFHGRLYIKQTDLEDSINFNIDKNPVFNVEALDKLIDLIEKNLREAGDFKLLSDGYSTKIIPI